VKPQALTWQSLDWRTLERLRDLFLSDTPPAGSYWTCRADVESYDFTFGQRVAWKWDAVLQELKARRWEPGCASLLDWGCGSGIASRRVVEWFGPESFRSLRVFDQSALAMDCAVEAARAAFPRLEVERADPGWLAGPEPIGLLVLSHVLNELTPGQLGDLLRLAARAAAVLWVEPGTHATGRALMGCRERLRADFTVLAPCTHQAPCGLLDPANERHWCHHFAPPPPAIMNDPDWVRFAHRLGIDLRRLPYSCLVLERRDRGTATAETRRAAMLPEGCSRILGRPRVYKGFAKVLSCQGDGVRELTLQKRDAPVEFKTLKSGPVPGVVRWKLAGDRITGVRPWDAA
jgi:ribosomal protein RSM22 (predicted rRNA methylase)